MRHRSAFTLIELLVVIAIIEEFLLQHPEWFIAGNHNIPADELAKFNATSQ